MLPVLNCSYFFQLYEFGEIRGKPKRETVEQLKHFNKPISLSWQISVNFQSRQEIEEHGKCERNVFQKTPHDEKLIHRRTNDGNSNVTWILPAT